MTLVTHRTIRWVLILSGILLVAARRARAQRAQRLQEQTIDEVLEESFPASDPPTWNSATTVPGR